MARKPKRSHRAYKEWASSWMEISLPDGNFTPLLGCDACLDLEVLEFMNLELITTPESKQREQEMPSFFQTDPVLQDYKDCFTDT